VNNVFCVECMCENPYILKKDKIHKTIRNKEYEFIVENAYCVKCGARVHVHGLDDKRAKNIDEQYRSYERLATLDEIDKLMSLYDIGKGPLALSLGFGEVTIKRYLAGVVPSKEYSDIIRRALEDPTYYKALLEKNKSKLNDNAYRKATVASNQLCQITDLSDTILATISYIFLRLEEVTPLALQKLLYFIQAHYLVKYDKSLFSEDCLTGKHGPVYNKVFDLLKDFKYNLIEDDRYAIIKNRYQILNDEQKEIIDLVLETYGMYNGKALEKIIYHQNSYLKAEENLINKKEDIQNYYKKLHLNYNLNTNKGILNYINQIITTNE